MLTLHFFLPFRESLINFIKNWGEDSLLSLWRLFLIRIWKHRLLKVRIVSLINGLKDGLELTLNNQYPYWYSTVEGHKNLFVPKIKLNTKVSLTVSLANNHFVLKLNSCCMRELLVAFFDNASLLPPKIKKVDNLRLLSDRAINYLKEIFFKFTLIIFGDLWGIRDR